MRAMPRIRSTFAASPRRPPSLRANGEVRRVQGDGEYQRPQHQRLGTARRCGSTAGLGPPPGDANEDVHDPGSNALLEFDVWLAGGNSCVNPSESSEAGCLAHGTPGSGQTPSRSARRSAGCQLGEPDAGLHHLRHAYEAGAETRSHWVGLPTGIMNAQLPRWSRVPAASSGGTRVPARARPGSQHRRDLRGIRSQFRHENHDRNDREQHDPNRQAGKAAWPGCHIARHAVGLRGCRQRQAAAEQDQHAATADARRSPSPSATRPSCGQS